MSATASTTGHAFGQGRTYIGPMGHAKQLLEDIEERGWAGVDGAVCSNCLTDPKLRSVIRSAGGRERCHFCGTVPIAPDASAETNLLVAIIVDGLRYEYEPPINHVAWSSRDGGYQMRTLSTADVLDREQVTENPKLIEALEKAIQEIEWVQRDPYAAPPADALRWGWNEFRDHVKHHRRFTFLDGSVSSRVGGELSMSAMPAALADAARDAQTVRVIPAGTKWWRIRPHERSEAHRSAKDLGAPPDSFAKDNRMSPKGIGAFYGASTLAGARAEVAGYADPAHDGTAAQFKQHIDIAVVDLSVLQAVPSLFDTAHRHRRAAAMFMRDFVVDVSAVASPSDLQNLDYIPTQIVAEYFRFTLKHGEIPVTGLLWSSSKDASVRNCVVFASNDTMSDMGTATDSTVFELDASSVRVLSAPL